MLSYFNGRDLLTRNCFMAYILYFAATLRLTIGLDKTGNISYICGNSTINAKSGTLLSSNFPDLYNNQENCVTNISIGSAFLIEITFEVLKTESISNLNLQNEMCALDFLEIVVNQRSMRICGDWTGKERMLYFIFITSFISIRFHSNEQNSNQGFALKWSTSSAHGSNPVVPCANSFLETSTSCFEIMTKPENWLSGHEICRQRGASLARIEDVQTQTEIETRLYNSMLRFHAIWIGAHDRFFEGDYMWPDRSAVQFHNWFPGWHPLNENETHNTRQPSDDGYSNEDCVEIRTLFSYPGKGTGQTRSFFWNDRNCNEKNPFICQHDKERGKRSTDQVPLYCDEPIQLTEAKSSVIVTSPRYPDNYPALTSCHTIVTAPIGKQIQIDFLHFDIEDGKRYCKSVLFGSSSDCAMWIITGRKATICEYDNLSVSDFPMTSKNHNVTRCGNWNRKLKLLRWTSDANNLVVSFQSDNTKQFSGFRINATLVDNGNLCNDEYSSGSGLIGPGGCWVIVNSTRNSTEADDTCASHGAYIAKGKPENIHFAAEVLNITDECKNVWMNPGNSRSSPINASNNSNDSVCDAVRICGSQKYQGNVLLEYKSVITQVPCSSLNYVFCQRPLKPLEKNKLRENITDESGNIDAYNTDGKNYNNSQNLTLHFQAKEGFRIIFKLIAYDIEYQDQCLYDYIETRGMTSDRKYCGKSTESVTFVSHYNSAWILFNTDVDITAAGFNLSWYWVKNGEAFQRLVQTENLSSMYSVNFPEAFPAEIENCSVISVPDDKHLFVVIEEINLPGSSCEDSSFEIVSGLGVVVKAFCGGTSLESLGYFSRYVLINSEDIRFCLKASRLQSGEGVLMQLRSVPGNSSKLSTTITLLPNQSTEFSSLMFPDLFPDETTQEVIFRTNIGYTMTLALNFTVQQRSKCSLDTLEINDISLKYDGNNLMLYSCANLTDDPDNRTEIVFSSVLNVVRVVVESGDHSSDSSSVKVSGLVTSVKDPLYLNKTRQLRGSFDECDNNTCKNGGSCVITSDKRFICTCQSQYTGLFCQASICDGDVNPCDSKHATCQLTNSGFICKCETGYWGDRCTMNSIMCQYKRCSGHGRCVLLNDTEIGCVCDDSYTGQRCSVIVTEPEVKLTIGQKLLKEPIWIGMIVILNLVFFFCVSYVIRRKCGTRIAKLIPKRTKTSTNGNSKENSKGEQSSASPDPIEKPLGKNVYTITLDPPMDREESRWSVRKKAYRDELDSISAPSTPVVTEANQEAAMKLFASYNTRKPDLSPNITSIQTARNNLAINTRDIMSCGIQGGTVTLNPDVEIENQTREPVHGILRSYTISTEIRNFESRTSKAKNEAMRKTSSYSGSPVTSRNTNVDFNLNSPKSKVMHCFPEIRIINEHNREEIKDSESECNSDTAIPELNNTYQSSSVENTREVKTSDHQDSGYPSTTISTTQDGSQVDEMAVKTIPSASERRKLFTSKAKSTSFYKLGKENVVKPKENRKDTLDSASGHSFKNSTSGDFPSFESEICVSCKRDQIERCAYSYETDLDKMHRCRVRQRSTTGYSSTYSHHHKRHRRRRKCGCLKHRSYSREVEFNSYDFHQPSVHLRREQYLPSGLHQSNENLEVRRFRRGIRPMNSSTESDSCLCSAQEMRYHRRHHVREAFSEHDFRRRHDSAPVQDFNYSPRIDFRSDDSCKSKLMRSFLSDTYRANFHNYSGSETTCEDHIKNKNLLCSHQNSSVASSRDKSRSRSPSPGGNSSLHLPLSIQRKRSDTVVEVADNNVIKLDSALVSPASSVSPLIRPFNSPSSSTDYNRTKTVDIEQARDKDSNNLECQKVFDYPPNAKNNSRSSDLPDVECVVKNTYSDLKMTESLESQNSVIDNETNPISVHINEISVSEKDSAYQTKQSSIDKLRSDTSKTGSVVMKSKRTDTTDSQDTLIRHDDRVHRHLHQAALKLALLKRLQAKKSFSKDSAIHTFSEDDLSADDTESRGPFRPLVKRTSGTLAFQLRETSLSQVKEENSGVSRDTENYNTPTNEPLIGSFDRSSSDKVSSAIPMTDLSTSYNDNTSVPLEETNV